MGFRLYLRSRWALRDAVPAGAVPVDDVVQVERLRDLLLGVELRRAKHPARLVLADQRRKTDDGMGGGIFVQGSGSRRRGGCSSRCGRSCGRGSQSEAVLEVVIGLASVREGDSGVVDDLLEGVAAGDLRRLGKVEDQESNIVVFVCARTILIEAFLRLRSHVPSAVVDAVDLLVLLAADVAGDVEALREAEHVALRPRVAEQKELGAN